MLISLKPKLPCSDRILIIMLLVGVVYSADSCELQYLLALLAVLFISTYIPPSTVLPIQQVGFTVIISLPEGCKGNYGS